MVNPDGEKSTLPGLPYLEWLSDRATRKRIKASYAWRKVRIQKSEIRKVSDLSGSSHLSLLPFLEVSGYIIEYGSSALLSTVRTTPFSSRVKTRLKAQDSALRRSKMTLSYPLAIELTAIKSCVM